jgi:hypothetical protein
MMHHFFLLSWDERHVVNPIIFYKKKGRAIGLDFAGLRSRQLVMG